MKNLDLTKLGVEKLDKKQMAEINGGISPEQARQMAEFWAPRVGQKGISLMDSVMEAFYAGYNS